MRLGVKELIVLLVLVAIPATSFVFVFKPQNEAIERAKSQIEHKEDMLSKLREYTAKNEDLKRANAQYETRIEQIEAQLPSDKGVDSIVRQVSDLAVAAGLAAPSLSTEDPLRAATYWEQPLVMDTIGRWDGGFYDFLLELERLPRRTRITSMKLTRDNQRDGLFEIEFTLSIYFHEGENS